MPAPGTTKEDLQLLLRYFPEVPLPVTVTDSSRDAFEQTNKPLPEMLSALFIEQWEGEVPDEFTEYLPGFHFRTKKQYGMVYWKAALLHYTYVLVLLDPDGVFLDRLVLAETDATSGTIRQGAAMISEDFEIFMVESALDATDIIGDPTQTITERWIITDEGRFRETEGK
ncbi:MAG: hypothetical protein KA479_07935 [Saprospiraceae bacterium]|nr:hypothetical protein [Saprospiraceae bacterium]